MFVGGLDPGNTGAVGMWDVGADKLFGVYDLPNYTVTINGNKRRRLDEDELHHLFSFFKDAGMVFLVIEQVGGWGGKNQSAHGAFTFGECFGVIKTTARYCGLTTAFASPSIWKPMEKVRKDEQAIVNKANIEFPEFKHLWIGKKGGLRHDRAEAAFLSRYAARRMWPASQPREALRKAAKGLK